MNAQRDAIGLNGTWAFAWLGDAVLSDVPTDSLVFDETMPVPGCFDAMPRYLGRRGVAAYRREIAGAAGRRSRLRLDGVHHTCRVVLNGRTVGTHHGGFVPVCIDLGVLDDRPHDLVVLVDNRFDSVSSPLHCEYFDWYHHGGITRGVWLEHLPDAYVERIEVHTLDHRSKAVRVSLHTAGQGEGDWSLSLAGVARGGGRCTAGDRIDCEFRADDLGLWSCETPTLHALTAAFGDDRVALQTGLRTIAVDGSELLLNGEPIRLHGVCRHELHPISGHAASPLQLQQDIDLLRELGANFVRGSHYPQHPAFLELCDRNGILVWSEGIAWQPRVEHLTDAGFLAAHDRHLDAMVHAAQHHPCIVMWGLFNEGDSDAEAAVPAYEAGLARLRDLDGSRPVTYATHRPFSDRCFALADVIAVNTYPGWYGSSIDQASEQLDAIADEFDRHPEARGKPRIVSEIGAGAIYGWRDPHGARWSEAYQARLLGTVLPALCDPAGRWNGVSIWQFSDVRTSEAVAKALNRPRGFNNKGLVDEYRRKKDAFAVVARAFRS
ncbi:MAG: glycoside hydrolase family 2 TIM barrel-domain containing protein [Planctomycetota bacterium]